jgi:hypothetical protein
MGAWSSTTGSSAGATKADAACSWFVCNRRAATGSHLQGRVGVDGQLLDLRIATSCPRPGTRAHGWPAAGPARQGRGRSAPAPARRSGSRRPGRTAWAGCAGRPVAQAVPAVGQHHCQVPQHLCVRVPPLPALGLPQSSALVSPASVVTSKLDRQLVACTRKVPSMTRDCDLQIAAFSLLERAPCGISNTPHQELKKAELSNFFNRLNATSRNPLANPGPDSARCQRGCPGGRTGPPRHHPGQGHDTGSR